MFLFAIAHFGERKTYYNLKERTLQHKLSVECLATKDDIKGYVENLAKNEYLDPRYVVVTFNLTQMGLPVKQIKPDKFAKKKKRDK